MDNIEIIIGTYENLILGYKIGCKVDGSYTLESSFTEDSHIGSLRCLYISPSGTLVSSSTDESVRLYNLIKRKDIGQLFQHSGAVNCIAFFKRSHMFSASEDGTICMWKIRKWEMMRVLKGHKAHVKAVAVHPSGKLGLSVGNDRSLLTWDFVTGKLAFQRKIKEAAQNILFTCSGNHYILVYLNRIEICSLGDTKIVQEIPTNWRINAACFVEDNILAIGGDDRHVLLVDVLTGEHVLTLDMAKPEEDSFSSRVRCLSVVICGGQNLVIAATANGNVKVYKVNLAEKNAEMVLFYEARVRITCMAAYNCLTDSKDEEEPSEPKQAKASAAPKPRKKDLVKAETNKLKAESEQSDEGDEEPEDEDPITSIQVKKRKARQPSLQQNKKRKLQPTETQQTRTESPKKKTKKIPLQSQPKAPQLSARPLKKLKKKKTKLLVK